MTTPAYELPHSWCPECEHHEPTSGRVFCPVCQKVEGEKVRLKALSDLGPADLQAVHLQAWSREVRRLGLRGLSPGGAASELGCHRSMIDKLVDAGVLEKSVFDERGHFVVYISKQSIDRAKESKLQTGKWTKTVKVEDATKQ